MPKLKDTLDALAQGLVEGIMNALKQTNFKGLAEAITEPPKALPAPKKAKPVRQLLAPKKPPKKARALPARKPKPQLLIEVRQKAKKTKEAIRLAIAKAVKNSKEEFPVEKDKTAYPRKTRAEVKRSMTQASQKLEEINRLMHRRRGLPAPHPLNSIPESDIVLKDGVWVCESMPLSFSSSRKRDVVRALKRSGVTVRS